MYHTQKNDANCLLQFRSLALVLNMCSYRCGILVTYFLFKMCSTNEPSNCADYIFYLSVR